MSDQSKDRLEGTLDEMTGRGKSALGNLSGDDETQAEGDTQQVQGEAKQGLADIKDKVDDAVKKVTGS